LRKITLVRWKTPSAARRLRSAGEVRKAVRNGEAAAEETAVVVNMPFLTWPGGKR
jgi:hypothetical protein